MEKSLALLMKDEIQRRLFEENFTRIFKCVDRLTEDQIWKKPNDQTNSIGNLILHLMGNVRQYVCSGLGGEKDVRNRANEFLLSSRSSKEHLFQIMEKLKKDVERTVMDLDENRFYEKIEVQGFSETGLSITVHVIEHFSYHVGQIALYTKMMLNEDLGFYKGLDLNAKSN